MSSRLISSLILLGTAVGAAPLAGQSGSATAFPWLLYGIEGGTCIHFLAPRDVAQDQLPNGFEAAAATAVTGLEPALAREIAADSQYGAWIPSKLCWLAADSARAGGRTTSAKFKAKTGVLEPVVVGYWAIAAVDRKAQGQGPRWIGASVFTNAGNLSFILGPTRYRTAEARMSITPIDSTADHRYQLKVDRVTIYWDGAPGDPRPAPPGDTLTLHQGFADLTLTTETPGTAFEPVGNLRIQGKGDLFKAISPGPIRFLGPLVRGKGEVRWEFGR